MPSISRREFGGVVAVVGAAGKLHAATGGAAKLDDTLRAGIAQRKIPAAVGMVGSERSILYSGAFGTRDSSGAAVGTDSIFQIASMTKAVTTVAGRHSVARHDNRIVLCQHTVGDVEGCVAGEDCGVDAVLDRNSIVAVT